jgi:hypothetical protein
MSVPACGRAWVRQPIKLQRILKQTSRQALNLFGVSLTVCPAQAQKELPHFTTVCLKIRSQTMARVFDAISTNNLGDVDD